MFVDVFKYLDNNVKDCNSKKILKNVYDKYGLDYMVNMLTFKNKGYDFENEFYIQTNLRDFEQTFTDIERVELLSVLPLGRFTSFSFWLESNNLNYDAFVILSASHRLQFVQSMRFDQQPITDDTFFSNEVNVQVNIGWNSSNELLIEWFINQEFVKLLNISLLCGSSAVLEFATSGNMFFMFGNGDYVKFSVPNKHLVSDSFISNYS